MGQLNKKQQLTLVLMPCSWFSTAMAESAARQQQQQQQQRQQQRQQPRATAAGGGLGGGPAQHSHRLQSRRAAGTF